MKRKIIWILAAMLVLAASSVCFAADNTWKLAGTWNYTLTVPEKLIGGHTISLTESGTITMHMREDAGVEYFSTFDLFGKGTLTVDGEEVPYDGKRQGESLKGLTGTEYIPGQECYIDDTQTVYGETLYIKYTLRQTGENTATGTARVDYGSESVVGTIEATRPTPSNGGGGGCSTGFASAALLLFAPLFAVAKRRK